VQKFDINLNWSWLMNILKKNFDWNKNENLC
jgi:hypothetical protein